MTKKESTKRFYSPNITVRVSQPTKNKLEVAAKAHDRSLRQEIEARIQTSFEAEDLAATLLDDKTLIAPLVVFARHYGRILKTATIERGSKLAIGLAGEVFRHTALSFVEGSLPRGLNDDYYDETSQQENDIALAKETKRALKSIEKNQTIHKRSTDHAIAIELIKKCESNISINKDNAPDILQKAYIAIHSMKEAEDAYQASKNLKEQMAWINNAVLQTSVHSDKND